MGSSLAFSLKEEPVRCTKVFDESWVILKQIPIIYIPTKPQCLRQQLKQVFSIQSTVRGMVNRLHPVLRVHSYITLALEGGRRSKNGPYCLFSVKFGFSEKATKFEKIFVLLMAKASCSVRVTAYLSKIRRKFFKINVDKQY